MSVLPSAEAQQIKELEEARLRAREIAQAQVESWRAVWESEAWGRVLVLVEAQRDISLKTLLGLSPSTPEYGTVAASLSGHIRALDWLLALPEKTTATSTAQVGI